MGDHQHRWMQSWFDRRSISSTASEFSVSRFPLARQPERSRGRAISARAIATAAVPHPTTPKDDDRDGPRYSATRRAATEFCVQRLAVFRNLMRDLDVGARGERGQQIEFLKNEAIRARRMRVRSASPSVEKSTPPMMTRPKSRASDRPAGRTASTCRCPRPDDAHKLPASMQRSRRAAPELQAFLNVDFARCSARIIASHQRL